MCAPFFSPPFVFFEKKERLAVTLENRARTLSVVSPFFRHATKKGRLSSGGDAGSSSPKHQTKSFSWISFFFPSSGMASPSTTLWPEKKMDRQGRPAGSNGRAASEHALRVAKREGRAPNPRVYAQRQFRTTRGKMSCSFFRIGNQGHLSAGSHHTTPFGPQCPTFFCKGEEEKKPTRGILWIWRARCFWRTVPVLAMPSSLSWTKQSVRAQCTKKVITKNVGNSNVGPNGCIGPFFRTNVDRLFRERKRGQTLQWSRILFFSSASTH
nr:hypothetical protein [Pandoravirus massiliensis]